MARMVMDGVPVMATAIEGAVGDGTSTMAIDSAMAGIIANMSPACCYNSQMLALLANISVATQIGS